MGFLDVVRAEYRFVYADVFRRKSVLIMFIMYPYMITAFILLVGYAVGSPSVFVKRVGIDPTVFFITSGFIMMAVIGVGDDILWRPIYDEWMGTLPYVLASPVSRIQHYLSIPLPRLTLVVISGSTSVLPVLVYYYGLNGFVEGLAVILLTMVASVFFISVALIITGIIYSLGGEHWRAINLVRPLLFILLSIYYPRYLLPLAGYIVSSLIPSSHVIEVIQRILSGRIPGYEYLFILLAVATALFILYTPVGVKSIVYWERKKVGEGVKT